VPVISSFFGIYIRMYHGDHNPPHLHAEYQGHEALITLDDGTVIAGSLPTKALNLIREWMAEHHDELLKDWERAAAYEPLERIAGADND